SGIKDFSDYFYRDLATCVINNCKRDLVDQCIVRQLVKRICRIERLHFKDVDVFAPAEHCRAVRQRSQQPRLHWHVNYYKPFDKALLVAKNLPQVFTYNVADTLWFQ